jgi:AraC-like DNA-binding protein
VLSWRVFGKARRNPPPMRLITKEGQRVIYQWLSALLISMIVLGIAWPFTLLWPHIWDINPDIKYYPIEIWLVFFIYWVAFTGYHRTQLIYVRANGSASALPDPEEAGRQLAMLKQAMERDKLYLEPNLNVARVAGHTTLPAKTLSAILNQYEQQSFNDFVNAYRVREVQARLLQPENRHLTISGVALEAGFNSQATFQRAFKNFTGMTPREWSTVHTAHSTANRT